LATLNLSFTAGGGKDSEKAMQGLRDFFEMGGYGAYVWPAYGITALVMLALLVTTLRGLSARQKAVSELEPLRRRQKNERGA
jgi:heme exporter protein D